MRSDVFWIGLIIGFGTWLMRWLPLAWASEREAGLPGWARRFFGAMGLCAMSALLAAALMPGVSGGSQTVSATAAGVAATVVSFRQWRNVTVSTFVGAVAYGIVVQLFQ